MNMFKKKNVTYKILYIVHCPLRCCGNYDCPAYRQKNVQLEKYENIVDFVKLFTFLICIYLFALAGSHCYTT